MDGTRQQTTERNRSKIWSVIDLRWINCFVFNLQEVTSCPISLNSFDFPISEHSTLNGSEATSYNSFFICRRFIRRFHSAVKVTGQQQHSFIGNGFEQMRQKGCGIEQLKGPGQVHFAPIYPIWSVSIWSIHFCPICCSSSFNHSNNLLAEAAKICNFCSVQNSALLYVNRVGSVKNGIFDLFYIQGMKPNKQSKMIGQKTKTTFCKNSKCLRICGYSNEFCVLQNIQIQN